MKKNNPRSWLTLSWFVLLSACSNTPPAVEPPPPTVLKLKISAVATLNPDIEGRPSPLVVRLYQFAAVDLFNNADFFALYNDDLTLLAKDLKFRKELEIRPGETKEMTLESPADARYFSVFAAYRNLDEAQWRTSLEIPRERTTPVQISFGNTAVEAKITAPPAE